MGCSGEYGQTALACSGDWFTFAEKQPQSGLMSAAYALYYTDVRHTAIDSLEQR
jgi:hypothetical protein